MTGPGDRSITPPLPRRLHLEITNRCNSLCETCVRTMEPDPERGVRVELNTNALTLRSERGRSLIAAGLDQLNVSVDGATAETYARIRGVGGLDRLVENVRWFVGERGADRPPRVEVWITMSRQNIHELPAIVDLAAEMGADGVYFQRLVYFGFGLARTDDSLHGRMSPEHEALIEEAVGRAAAHGLTVAASGGYAPLQMLRATDEPEPYRTCRRPFESAVVMANGDVVPCCISTFVAPRPTITMGNVIEQSWAAVWHGERYQSFREALLRGEPPKSCRQCGICWSL